MGSNRNSIPLNNSEHSPTSDINMSLMDKNKEEKKGRSSHDLTRSFYKYS